MEIATNSNLIKETKQLHLSTRTSAGDVKNGTYRSLIEYCVPAFITHDDSIEYIQFSIQSAIIPVSFYNINNEHNTLVIIENGITSTYIFPNGNYNSSLFITRFKALTGDNFNITLDTATSIFTITNAVYNFTIDSSTTIDYIMGFSGNVSSTGLSLTMPRVCNFLALPRVNIRCGYLANGVVATVAAANSDNDVVLSVPNNSFPNGQIVYTDGNSSVNIFKGDRLDCFTISLTNDDGEYIDFNGVSSFFTFQFDIFRKYLIKPDKFRNIVDKVNAFL